MPMSEVLRFTVKDFDSTPERRDAARATRRRKARQRAGLQRGLTAREIGGDWECPSESSLPEHGGLP